MLGSQSLTRETQSFLKRVNPEVFEEIGVDFSLLLALSKKDTFDVTCLKFKKKYGMEYTNFLHLVDRKREEKSFDMDYLEMRDDLMDWEFAEAAKGWWLAKIEKISMKT